MTTRKSRNPSNPSVPQRSISKSLQTHKPHHSHHISYPSDSEPPLDLPPTLPTRTNSQLNLLVLRRHYPSTASILSLAPYAVLYAFNPSSSAWEKSGIEGTLFVCSLTSPMSEKWQERYAVTILNRRGLENFWLELTRGEEVEVTAEYVILQGGEGEEGKVYGLWIFEEGAGSTKGIREVTARLIKECAEAAGGAADDGNGADTVEDAGVMENGPEEETIGTRYSKLEEEFDRAKAELEEVQRRRKQQHTQQHHQSNQQAPHTSPLNSPYPFQPHPRHFAAQPQSQPPSIQHLPPDYQPPSQDTPYPFQPHPRHFQPQHQSPTIHQPTHQPHPPTAHQPPPEHQQSLQSQPPASAFPLAPPLFAPSPDTQFFLSAPRPQPQNDVLSQLFAKARGSVS